MRVIDYDKNDPTWGEKLKAAITKSIEEIRAAPLTSVLPTFLEVRQAKKPEVSEREKELLTLGQEMEQLRRELRMSRLRERPINSGRVEAIRRSSPGRMPSCAR